MENQINYKNFECYWILVDILNSRFLKHQNNSKCEGYLKDYYETSNDIGMEVYPTITVKDEIGEVLGFGMLRAHNPIPTFSQTAEITYFIKPEYTRRGIGSKTKR